MNQGDVAQVGERLPCTEEARGSSPLISIRLEYVQVGDVDHSIRGGLIDCGKRDGILTGLGCQVGFLRLWGEGLTY